jgi:hypothetical protein
MNMEIGYRAKIRKIHENDPTPADFNGFLTISSQTVDPARRALS